MGYAIGNLFLIMIAIVAIMVMMYYVMLALTHTKIIRLTIGEAVLGAQFEGALLLLLGLLIGQQYLLATFVFFIFLFFTLLLFVKRIRRWYYERLLRKADSSTFQKEFKDSGRF